MRRQRNVKILATLGPASVVAGAIGRLFEAGADVFRLNFSHGSHADHRERLDIIRRLEEEYDRPIGILVDLQGPKLRVGRFAGGHVELKPGRPSARPRARAGRRRRAHRCPIPSCCRAGGRPPAAARRRQAAPSGRPSVDAEHPPRRVVTGGRLTDRKGVNLPDVVLPSRR